LTDSDRARQRWERLVHKYRTVDGQDVVKLCDAGLQWLRANQELVNSLNVFPVPDGDTGTNMVLTMKSAAQEVEGSGEKSVGKIAHAIAHGALMGARGNSGVILSQLWRGVARALEGESVLDVDNLVTALGEARDTAYKGVVRPVEGTILTVSKAVASGAQQARENGATSVLEVLEVLVAKADESVEGTPDLLPVLKEAGVVDAGGKGLFFLLEGMLRLAKRQPLDEAEPAMQPLSAISLSAESELIEPGQDWEVVVDFKTQRDLDIDQLYEDLEALGTSVQLGQGDGMHRMHIHTRDQEQYKPIEYCRSLGTVTRVAIENLMVEGGEHLSDAEESFPFPARIEPDQIAAVVVAPGAGIARVFASLGAAAIVRGGQTMNPSTEEILSALENLPSDKIVILPNNKNILLAARQSAEMTVKQVRIVPSVSVPQGVAAMFALDPDGDIEQVFRAMESAITEPQSGALTTATRSAEIDGVRVKQGQVIGMLDGQLVTAGDSLEPTLIELLRMADTEAAELVTLYYGADLTPAQSNQMADRVRELWPNLEVEVVEGGQPHYSFLVAIE
jgi:DAK2 domain fusion protein YloV